VDQRAEADILLRRAPDGAQQHAYVRTVPDRHPRLPSGAQVTGVFGTIA
jgi:hypothetical protein